MGLKKSFANVATEYQDMSAGDAEEKIIYVGLPALVMGMVGAMFGMGASEMLPMDDSIKPYAEQAVTEYMTALDALENAQTELRPSATPSPLQDLIGTETLREDITNTEPEKTMFALARKFGTSLIIDDRLSETQAKELTEAFESRIGDFEQYTGYDTPDFADLDEARQATAHSEIPEIEAQNVNDSTYNNLHNGDVIIGTALGAMSLPFLLLLSAGMIGRRRLDSWASEKPYKKPPRFKH